MRILAVEDDPAILRMLERGLVAAGHQVLTAASGEDGALLATEETDRLRRVVSRVAWTSPLDAGGGLGARRLWVVELGVEGGRPPRPDMSDLSVEKAFFI